MEYDEFEDSFEDDREYRNELESELYARVHYNDDNNIEDFMALGTDKGHFDKIISPSQENNMCYSVIDKFNITQNSAELTSNERQIICPLKDQNIHSSTVDKTDNTQNFTELINDTKQIDQMIPIQKEDTRYGVINKLKKTKQIKIEKSNENINDSDSNESIFEVPLSPKPQPPMIILQDSDEDLNINPINLYNEDSSSDVEIISEGTTNENNSDNSIDDNIMINCTQLRKGATSLSELKGIVESAKSEKNRITKKKVGNNDNLQETFQTENLKQTCGNQFEGFSGDTEIMNTRKRHNTSNNIEESNCKRTKYSNNHNSKTIGNEKKLSWEEYIFQPMHPAVKAFYNNTNGLLKFDHNEMKNKMSKDPRLWTVLHSDLLSKSKKRRFWNIKSMYCSKCKEYSHETSECTKPKRPQTCHVCGKLGHLSNRCPDRMCLTCGKKQSSFRNMCESCRIYFCTMCKAIGHRNINCPDLWRRYHQTTSPLKLNIPVRNALKPVEQRHCCNCGKKGHDFSMCKSQPFSRHYPTPVAVTNYTDGPQYYEEPSIEHTTALSSNSVDSMPGDPELDSTKLEQVPNDSNITTLPENAERNNVTSSSSCSEQNEKIIFFYETPISMKSTKYKVIKEQLSTHLKLDRLINKNFRFACFDKCMNDLPMRMRVFQQNNISYLEITSLQSIAYLLLKFFKIWLKLETENKKVFCFLQIPFDREYLLNILGQMRVGASEVKKFPNNTIHVKQLQKLKSLLISKQGNHLKRQEIDKLIVMQTKLTIQCKKIYNYETFDNITSNVRVALRNWKDNPLISFLRFIVMCVELFANDKNSVSGCNDTQSTVTENINQSQNSSNLNPNVTNKKDCQLEKQHKKNKSNQNHIMQINTNYELNKLHIDVMKSIERAHKYAKVPHVQDSINKLHQKLKNNTVQKSHIKALNALINVEELYQKHRKNLGQLLNTG